MKKILLTATIILALASGCSTKVDPVKDTTIHINMIGNSYITKGQVKEDRQAEAITINAAEPTVASLFFKTDTIGRLNLALVGSASQGESTIKVTVLGKDFDVKFSKSTIDSIGVGSVEVSVPGYIRVDFSPLTGSTNLTALRVGGSATMGKLIYVKDFSTYWGRRGPSVHLKYTMPEEPTQWVYNEVTIPKENDVIGSYYMANGFGQGYFGMQCNSETERRILFSVWSPFVTDDPTSIPEDEKIVLLRRGVDVSIGEFGNEGSGGQSYLKFPWITGETYRFLTEVRPDKKGSTIYTGYFYAPEDGTWRLIASFRRPKTDTYYTGAHSFLENFIPNQGYLPREVYFGNAWAKGVDGKWREMTQATFTYDATAAAGVRQDYAGGSLGDKFYLKNCGFFNENSEYKSVSERTANGKEPVINFSMLEKL